MRTAKASAENKSRHKRPDLKLYKQNIGAGQRQGGGQRSAQGRRVTQGTEQVKFLHSRQQVGFYFTAEYEEEEAELQQAGGGAAAS